MTTPDDAGKRLEEAESLIRQLLYGPLLMSCFNEDVKACPACIIVRCAIRREQYEEMVRKYPRETGK